MEFNGMTVLDGSLSGDKYVKSVSGSNISGLTLRSNPEMRIPGLTSIAVQGGAKFDFDFDFSFPYTSEYAHNGTVQAGPISLHISLGDDIAMSAGIPAPAFMAVAVNVGETSAVIAGNVRDTLAVALGSDWTVTATGSRLNVAHNFAGNFSPGIRIEAQLGGDQIGDGLLWDPGEWETGAFGDSPTGNVAGTSGRDAIVTINGEEANFTNVNMRGWSADNWDPDGLHMGHLRGRDTLLNLHHTIDGFDPEFDSSHHNQFTFRIDDATVNSGAIISTRDSSQLTLQVGANTGYDQTVRIGIQQLSSNSIGISELNVFTHQEAQNAVASIDIASQIVSDQRATLGAIQNRLEHTMNNLDTVAENLQDAESRLRDADMAKEMMEFTKNNILLQASQAMAAQAYNIPQGVLQLLRA
jgi:flagellin-like hook-associated protein FlgL